MNNEGVYLDGEKISGCFQVDLKNLNYVKEPEAVLHIAVDEIRVDYASPFLNKLGDK